MQALTKLRAQVPPEVVGVHAPPGARPEDGGADLARARRHDARRAEGGGRGRQRLRTLSGLGAKTEEKILEGARGRRRARSEPSARLLGKALPAVRARGRGARGAPGGDRGLGGGQRPAAPRDGPRPRPDRDRDRPAGADRAFFAELDWVAEVVAHGDTKATVVSHDGLRFDLRVVPPECYGNLLQHFTGSKDHNVALREEAVRRGLSVSEYGVTDVETGEVVTFRDEEEVYEFLGYACIPPELRENARRARGRARAATLPRLVELGDLRGRPALPLDLVGGRQGDARGDGARGRRRAATRSSPSPTTRTTCATGGSRRSGEEIDERQRARRRRSASCAGSR